MKGVIIVLAVELWLVTGVGCGNQDQACTAQLVDQYAEFMDLAREAAMGRDEIEAARKQIGATIKGCGGVPHVVHVKMLGDITETEFAILSDEQELVQRSVDELLACRSCGKQVTESLHFAAAFGTPEAIKYFAAKQVGIDSRDRFGNTPLISTIGGAQIDLENTKAVVALGANINAIADNGMTALTVAVAESDVDAVKYLLEAGASVTPSGRGDRSIIELALRLHDQQIISLLGIDESGVSSR